MKRITVNLEDDVARKLKLAATISDKTMKDYLAALIVSSVGTINVTRKTEAK